MDVTKHPESKAKARYIPGFRGLQRRRAFWLLACNRVENGEQFVHPVSARVPALNGRHSLARQCRRQARLVQYCAQVPLHLRSIAGDEKIATGCEELLHIIPPGGDERNATRQCLEGPDRGYAAERLNVRATRDMHGRAEMREDLRDFEIGEPAAVADPGAGERLQCRLGVS